VGDLSMPPTGALSPNEVSAMREWIDAGAVWTAGSPSPAATWWAFGKPVRPAVPEAAKNPIDAFIDRKLAAAGVPKSPEADRLTLLKRAS
jgi:hypothetical protein